MCAVHTVYNEHVCDGFVLNKLQSVEAIRENTNWSYQKFIGNINSQLQWH